MKSGFALLLAVLLPFAFSLVQPSASLQAMNPNTLVIMTPGEPEKLEPATDYEPRGVWILENVYETAWFYDTERADSRAPLLATGLPTVTADGLTITFTLKPDIYSVSYEPGVQGADAQGFRKWGPLTAADVKYSFDRTVIIGHPRGGPAWMYEYVRGAAAYMWGEKRGTEEGMNEYLAAGGVTIDGPMTVSVHLTAPVFNHYQVYVMMMPWYAIYSKECIESHGGLQPWQENQWLLTHTCGTGPYVVTEWTPEEGLVMEANPYWHDYIADEYPKLTTVVEEFVREDSVRVEALKRGDADFANIPPSYIAEFVNPYARPPTTTFPGVAIYPSPAPPLTLYHISLQMDPAKRPGSPFTDLRVRQAFQYIADKRSIIDMALKGLAIPAQAPIVEGLPCYEEAKPTTTYTYNRTTARQVLLDAGYSSDNPIHVVFGYNSENLIRAATVFHLKAAAESYEMFDLEGDPFVFIDARGEPEPYYVRNRDAGTEYDMFMYGWIAEFPDPDNFIFHHLDGHERGAFASQVGFNDTQLNEWIAEARVTPRPQACSLYKQIQERAAMLSPHIYIYQPIDLFLQRDWVQEFYPYSTNPIQYGYGFVWKMWKGYPPTTTTITTTTTMATTTLATTTTVPVSILPIAVVSGALASTLCIVGARQHGGRKISRLQSFSSQTTYSK